MTMTFITTIQDLLYLPRSTCYSGDIVVAMVVRIVHSIIKWYLSPAAPACWKNGKIRKQMSLNCCYYEK